MNPLISIIIPTLNCDSTLQSCIDSIISQTFSKYEVIIVDGVSSDNTLNIAKSYYDSRINIHSEPDSGIYYAMNKGIRKAKGEWIYFIGSDDRLYSNHTLANVSRSILNGNFDIIYGNVLSDRFNGIYDGEFSYQKLYEKNICHQSIFFNKLIFNKIGGYNLKYKVLADYDHNIRWFLNRKIRKQYIDEIIAEYGKNGISSCTDDKIFESDKNYNYVLSGFFTLPKWYLMELCMMGNDNRIYNSLLKSLLLYLKLRRKANLCLYSYIRRSSQ